jgi:nucleoside phosphorylase
MKLTDPSFERAKTQSRARRKRVVLNMLKYVSTHRLLVVISALSSAALATTLSVAIWINTGSAAGAAQARASPDETVISGGSNQGLQLKFSTTLSPISISQIKESNKP